MSETNHVSGNSPGVRLPWSERYGARHRLERVTEFPRGVAPPKKVRLYWRRDHYILQWWGRSEGRTLSDRVNGDLITALTRVREIESRMDQLGTSGNGRTRLSFSELLLKYEQDLERRADAGEVDVRTVSRYASALRYLKRFVEQDAIRRGFPHPDRVDRNFVLSFQAFLRTQHATRNGRAAGAARPMHSSGYVLATVNAVFAWAADPQRGALLPAGFVNPFSGLECRIRQVAADLSQPPPITIPMAMDFLTRCDDHQWRLFTPLVLFGLRPAELAWVFWEDIHEGWWHIRCREELDFLTKGARDKKFPLTPVLQPVWDDLQAQRTSGLWMCRPSTGLRRSYPLQAIPAESLAKEFRTRLISTRSETAASRRAVRDALLQEAGAIDYDFIEREFHRVADSLGWPASATLKGFRHLFATALEDAGCPESYKRYFMGHSPGRAALVRYTHLAQLTRHYERLLETEFRPVVDCLLRRCEARPGSIGPAELAEH